MTGTMTILLALLAVGAVSSVPRNFKCQDVGIFPDPDDCSGFYMCSHGLGGFDEEHFECAEGYLFDALLLVCNFDYAVDCGERPRPDGPSTVSTESTSTTSETTTITVESTTTTTTTTTIETGDTTPTTTTTTTTTIETGDTTPTILTTTTTRTTTTGGGGGGGRFPKKSLGMYVLLADDTEDGFHSDADWYPKLFEYQQKGANVLFFTFINPDTMDVPLAFERLAATRGTDAEGAVPKDTKIIFAIGGYAYSLVYNPWHWLTSQSAAEAMAEKVSTWFDKYNVDGIDLDIEEGAGSKPESGTNMAHFVRKLRQLRPDVIVGQPTYGFPAVAAEIDVINESWNVDSTSNNVADSVGLMVYEGTQALQYVKNYAQGADQWEGFPIKVNVPTGAIMLGCKGSSSRQDIMTLAEESVNQDLLGIMVWYVSVVDGLRYQESWDGSYSDDSIQGYIEAMEYFKNHMG